MVKEFKMSQARYDELKRELDYDKTTRTDEIAELIKEARGFGDLSENSEYDEAKNEQGKLYSRIAELEEILLHAVIVDEAEDSDKISIGVSVTIIVINNDWIAVVIHLVIVEIECIITASGNGSCFIVRVWQIPLNVLEGYNGFRTVYPIVLFGWS